MFVVLFNHGACITVPRGEAQMWAMLSVNALNCNVYRVGGGAIPLNPCEV